MKTKHFSLDAGTKNARREGDNQRIDTDQFALKLNIFLWMQGLILQGIIGPHSGPIRQFGTRAEIENFIQIDTSWITSDDFYTLCTFKIIFISICL